MTDRAHLQRLLGPQLGERVEVRLAGRIVDERTHQSGRRLVKIELDPEEVSSEIGNYSCSTWEFADQVAQLEVAAEHPDLVGDVEATATHPPCPACGLRELVLGESGIECPNGHTR
jgi:hypothetical protein